MELHILFFVLAGLLILFLVGYSVWSARREKSRVFSNTFANRPQQPPAFENENAPAFSQPQTAPLSSNPFPQQSSFQPQPEPIQDPFLDHEVEKSLSSIKISLPNQAPSEPPAPQAAPEFVQQSLNYEEPPAPAAEIAPQIITLYLVAPENQVFNGEMVVQKLEEVGFQYGEHKIFHRHIDNPNSPVIFSVANMMQPGIFDLSNLHRFTTVGLVFFMHIPSSGNDIANLRLMIRSVETLAQSLGGFVLNDQQELFDDQSRLAYMQRVQQ